ncbi:PLP-dependent aminotransferase family protein [Mesorhizobium sp.]|uniref:MocR-like pyridoxine biosynthesis transcription factor PdxR n=1 Tax=Mesorhizobium sp. TaxID=1871066 RepID=UPI00257DB4F6|nr:PLP-dependent aminotransferase family protein [Mesorhizobium sp.]
MIGLTIDRVSDVTIFRQIYLGLREAIVSGRLMTGSRLMSTRALAEELKVSRNSVTQAYEQLIAEGYIRGRIGSGTFVTDVSTDFFHSDTRRSAEKIISRPYELSQLGRIAEGWWPSLPLGERQPFSPGICVLDGRSLQILRKLGQRHLITLGETHASYSHPQGLPELREQIAIYLRAARAVRCDADNIIVVSGGQQAVDLALKVMVDRGSYVWLEDPCYSTTRAAVESIGARIFPVPVDCEGMNVGFGIANCKTARMSFVTPSHQYPLGVTLSLQRRLELLRWAGENNSWIIEDDFDSEIRYEGRPLASLQGLDEASRVIYIGTFSKMLLPGLRVGYVVVPQRLVPAFLAARFLADRQPPMFQQLVMADFLAEGHLTSHLSRMRRIYRQARDQVCDIINCSLSEHIDTLPTVQGTQLFAHLRDERIDDVEFCRRAASLGVALKPISPMCIERTDARGLLLAFAGFSQTEISLGVSRLVRLFLSQRPPVSVG